MCPAFTPRLFADGGKESPINMGTGTTRFGHSSSVPVSLSHPSSSALFPHGGGCKRTTQQFCELHVHGGKFLSFSVPLFSITDSTFYRWFFLVFRVYWTISSASCRCFRTPIILASSRRFWRFSVRTLNGFLRSWLRYCTSLGFFPLVFGFVRVDFEWTLLLYILPLQGSGYGGLPQVGCLCSSAEGQQFEVHLLGLGSLGCGGSFFFLEGNDHRFV